MREGLLSGALGIPDAFHLCPRCGTGVSGSMCCYRCTELRKRSKNSWRPPGSAKPRELGLRIREFVSFVGNLVLFLAIACFLGLAWSVAWYAGAEIVHAIGRVL